uniref:Diacylglycerol kinase type I N-terminal domain-containing protein n=1 Tax=Anopheles coluzzii TaxID=1518534 RepID=A0A8W7PHW2_ANOCL
MASNIHKWEKLSPSEFQQLQDLASYSTKKLQNVLQEFCSPATPSASRFHPDGALPDDIQARFAGPARLGASSFINRKKKNDPQLLCFSRKAPGLFAGVDENVLTRFGGGSS